MRISTSMRWLVVAVSAAMLLAVAAACSSETIEVPGETVVVKEEVIKTVEVPGETVVKEVIKEVQVPGETVVVEKEVVKEVMVPGETVVVEKVVTETVEVPGETVTVEVVKEVEVPGETVVVEKEVVKTVEVPGETVVVEKEVVKTVEVPGETVVVEKEVVKTVEVPVEVVVEKEVVRVVEVVKEVEVLVPAEIQEVTKAAAGKPIFGGTLRLGWQADSGGKWDMCEFREQGFLSGVVEHFLVGDFRLGPSGEGLTTFSPVRSLGTDLIAKGSLADSWDRPDPVTYRFHLRPGLKWMNKFPTFGRPVEAQEIADELERIRVCRHPRHDFLDSVTAEDSDGDGTLDSVVFNANQPISFWGYEFAWGPYFLAAPPETIEAGTDNVENQSGTGPWMATGFTQSSTVSFERNPDWWETYTHEGVEYNIPFIDNLQYFIILQPEVRRAAFRTAKIDKLDRVAVLDRAEVEATSPDLNYRTLAAADSFNYFMPMNKPPFDDIRVRIAMNNAIDRDVYTNTLLGGESILLAHPMTPEWPLHYEPLEDMAQMVQDYFKYDPAKAEALLDEAGLPRGADGVRFEIDMMIGNYNQLEIDAAQISLGFWDDIGVKITLDVVDGSVQRTRLFEKQFDLMAGGVGGRPNALNDFRLGNQYNRSNLDDPEFHTKWDDVLAAITSEDQVRLIKEASRLWLELAPAVQVPAFFEADYWQPWVLNHNGERYLKFGDSITHWAYAWIDRDARAERTGFRD